MIVKGKSRNNAAQAGSYLLRQGKNERVELIETRGTLAQDVKGACVEMEALAAGSNAEKPFYHASINPAKGERLTPEQWEISTELLEKKLGLEGHQRIIVEHEKNGGVHRHIFWNRVNQETLVAARMSWNYVQHEQTAREIENAFGLQKVQGVHARENGELREKGDSRAHYAPTHKEIEDGKKSGVNVYKWQKEIRKITAEAESKSGAEFIAALEAKGHMVAKGDNVAFVILDPSGKAHRMAQKLGMGVDDLKEKLSGIEREALPNETHAREQQKARLAEIEKTNAAQQADPAATFRPKDILNRLYADEKIRQQEEIIEIGSTAEDGISFVIAMQDKGFQVAKNKYGNLTAVNSKGFEISLKSTKAAIFEDIAALEKNGLVIPSSDQVREEQKLGREEQRRLSAERREKYQQEKELFHHRLFATSYKNGGMASQERDAIFEAIRRNRAANAPRPLHPDEHNAKQTPEPQKERQGGAIGKENTDANRERGGKAAGKERTEAQIREEQKNAMREMFEMKFGRGRNESEREGWERSRERER